MDHPSRLSLKRFASQLDPLGKEAMDIPNNLTPEALQRETASLRALARELVPEHDAEDVAQETWLAALKHGEGPRRWRPWLRRVVANFALKLRRKRNSQRKWEESAAKREALSSSADVVERMALNRDLVDAVLALGEPYRTTVVLRFWEALPPRHVAEAMEVPVGTVRTRLRRALEMLRARLDGKYGDRERWRALVPLGLRAPSGAEPAVPGSFAAGVLIMGIKLKLALVGMAVLLTAGLSWYVVAGAPDAAPLPPVVDGVTNRAVGTLSGTEQALAAEIERSPLSVSESQPSRFGFVTGRVVGKDTGMPLPGAEIRLMGRFAQNWDDPPRGMSDQEGRFAIRPDHLGEGNFQMDYEVHAPGYATHRGDLDDRQDQLVPEGTDLGDLVVPRGALVRGRVVQAVGGTPVSGARLFLIESIHTAFSILSFSMAEAVGVSGDDGSFVLPRRLSPTRMRGHALLARSDQGFGLALVDVVPERDEVSDVEVSLHTTADLSVSVLDPEGRPVPGARLRVRPVFEPYLFFRVVGDELQYAVFWKGPAELVELLTALTDEEGRASFSGLPLGPVRSEPGKQGWQYELLGVAEGFVNGHQRLSLYREQENRVTLRLVRTRAITLIGTVSSEGGAPVPGATVDALGTVVETDPRGLFRMEFPALDTDHFSATARADGYVAVLQQVEVPVEESAAEMDFVLGRAAPIEGRVVDQHGVAVKGVVVELRRRSQDLGGIRSGADGRFQFRDATEADWQLSVAPGTGEGEFEPTDTITVTGGTSVDVVLTRLPEGYTRLVAEIVDYGTGAPVDPVSAQVLESGLLGLKSVVAARPAERASGLVSADGLRAGDWRLILETRDGTLVQHDFTIEPGETEKHLRVAVGPSGVVAGTVVFEDLPVELRPERVHFTVFPNVAGVWASEPGVRVSGVTTGYFRVDRGGDRMFRMEELPVLKPLLLRSWDRDGIIGEAEVVVPVEGEAHVEIRLQQAARVSFSSEGHGTGRAVISISHQGGGWWERAWLDLESGEPLLKEVYLRPGRNRWRVRFLGEQLGEELLSVVEKTGELIVRAGETREVKLDLR